LPQFHVKIADDALNFSAAHFITYAGGQCEALHGHNYRVIAEVTGPLDENRYVVDFIVLGQRLSAILAELDHAVLLPTDHPSIRVAVADTEVEVRFADRRWVFPRAECRLLPLVNTTAELLADHLARRLLQVLQADGLRPERVRIELEEWPGRWAICELTQP
jgi:6-pyruvoyltetrahydropterin/6-carboxytetrahydropterin synthase